MIELHGRTPASVYDLVQTSVEDNIRWLLQQRNRDPFEDTIGRVLWETSWGGQRAAPTFDLRRSAKGAAETSDK